MEFFEGLFMAKLELETSCKPSHKSNLSIADIPRLSAHQQLSTLRDQVLWTILGSTCPTISFFWNACHNNVAQVSAKECVGNL